MNYLKFWFWMDLISSFPYDLVFQQLQSSEESDSTYQRNAQLIKIIRFVKFIKVVRLLRALKLKIMIAKIEG